MVLSPGAPNSYVQCHVGVSDPLFTPGPSIGVSWSQKAFSGPLHTCQCAFGTPRDVHTDGFTGTSRQAWNTDAREAGRGRRRRTGPGTCVCLAIACAGRQSHIQHCTCGPRKAVGRSRSGPLPVEGMLTEFGRVTACMRRLMREEGGRCSWKMGQCELKLDWAITRNYKHSDRPLTPCFRGKGTGMGVGGSCGLLFTSSCPGENLAKGGSGWEQPRYPRWVHWSRVLHCECDFCAILLPGRVGTGKLS